MDSRNQTTQQGINAQAEWGQTSGTESEKKFLEGPHSRGWELLRAIEIFFEVIRGFRKLHFVGPCVTVYGSARIPEGHPYYELARQVGRGLAETGFTVTTGGGPGLMEAANRGAKEAGGYSLGCNMTLPREQAHNRFLDRWVEFKYFMIRKFMLAKYSYGFVAMPGGFGTMDELFGVLTLIQTKKMKRYPVVLIGVEYWSPLKNFIEDRLRGERLIEPEDTQLILITDSAEEAVAHIRKIALAELGVRFRAVARPSWILGER